MTLDHYVLEVYGRTRALDMVRLGSYLPMEWDHGYVGRGPIGLALVVVGMDIVVQSQVLSFS